MKSLADEIEAIPRVWTAAHGLVREQDELVRELGMRVMNGESVPKLLWARLDSVEKRARVSDPHSPGPGHYHKETHASSLGTQVASGRRSTRGHAFAQKHRAADLMKLPTRTKGAYRVKNRVSVMAKTEKPPSKSEAQALWVPPSSVGRQVESTKPSLPSFTQKGRLPDPRLRVMTQTPGPSITSSSVGTQLLSTNPTGARAAFTRSANRGAGGQRTVEEQRNAPSVHSYYPKYEAARASTPAATIKSRPNDEFNPHRAYDAAPGSYLPDGGVGNRWADSMRPTKPMFTFGEDPFANSVSDLKLAKFLEAQDRRQPLGVRHVHTRKYPERLPGSGLDKGLNESAFA